MIVLHLLSSSTFSGAENVVCQIINLSKQFPNLEMYYCSPIGPIKEVLQNAHISYIPITSLSVKNVKSIIKQIQPDIIHAHDMRACFISSIVCGKQKLISHIHNNNFDSRCLSVKSIAFLYAAFRSKNIIWVSKSSYEGYFFSHVFSRKSKIIYNTINLPDLFNKVQKDTKNYNYDIVYVGRLNYIKNPTRIITICANIIQKLPNLKIAIVGDGDLKEEMLSLINNYNISQNIKMLGFVNNPYKIIHQSKIMIMTSLTEGTPMCALESISLGTPIISTPVGGMVDIITNNVNGYLCEENDDFENRIIEYLTDDQIQMNFKKSCIEKSLILNDSNSYIKQIVRLYNN